MSKEKILITGANGLVGSRVVELWPNNSQLLTPSSREFDLTNLDKVKNYLKEQRPTTVINFAAFTDVSGAEKDKSLANKCWEINVGGVENLACALEEFPAFLVQISTDMIFSGRNGPYAEDSNVENDRMKLTVYGNSKAKAEKLVSKINATIVRLIYPVRANFPNKLDYLRFPLSLYKQGKLYPLFDDQLVSFTFIDELAVALQTIVSHKLSGTYHVSSDLFTPYELITFTLKKMGLSTDSIKRASLEEFLEKSPNPYRYPLKGGLKTDESSARLEMEFKTWPEVVESLIKQGLCA